MTAQSSHVRYREVSKRAVRKKFIFGIQLISLFFQKQKNLQECAFTGS